MKKLFLLTALVTLMTSATIEGAPRFQVTPPQTPASPEAVVRDFYRWYLQTLYKNKEPFKNRAVTARYVTPRLIQWLTRRMKGPDPIDYDYFLNAQDYGETWDKQISISKLSIQNGTAKMDVGFGKSPDFDHKVKVTLKQIKGVWLIDKVDPRDDQPSGHL